MLSCPSPSSKGNDAPTTTEGGDGAVNTDVVEGAAAVEVKPAAQRVKKLGAPVLVHEVEPNRQNNDERPPKKVLYREKQSNNQVRQYKSPKIMEPPPTVHKSTVPQQMLVAPSPSQEDGRLHPATKRVLPIMDPTDKNEPPLCNIGVGHGKVVNEGEGRPSDAELAAVHGAPVVGSHTPRGSRSRPTAAVDDDADTSLSPARANLFGQKSNEKPSVPAAAMPPSQPPIANNNNSMDMPPSSYEDRPHEPADDYLTRSWTETIFPMKLYDILCNPEFHHAITWMTHGRSWKVINKEFFMAEICPQYFDQKLYASFIRQVNGWGFKRVWSEGQDRSSYFHEHFLRGYPNLIDHMRRPLPGEKVKDDRATPDFYAMPPMPALPPPDPARLARLQQLSAMHKRKANKAKVGRPAGSVGVKTTGGGHLHLSTESWDKKSPSSSGSPENGSGSLEKGAMPPGPPPPPYNPYMSYPMPPMSPSVYGSETSNNSQQKGSYAPYPPPMYPPYGPPPPPGYYGQPPPPSDQPESSKGSNPPPPPPPYNYPPYPGQYSYGFTSSRADAASNKRERDYEAGESPSSKRQAPGNMYSGPPPPYPYYQYPGPPSGGHAAPPYPPHYYGPNIPGGPDGKGPPPPPPPGYPGHNRPGYPGHNPY